MRLTDKQRKFAGEVGSVVLGVLIALAIGELAEAVRWSIRVTQSVSAVRTELSGNRFHLVERLAYQPCIEQRLATIGSILADAQKTAALPHIENLGRPDFHITETAAFEVAKSEGVPLHMDRDDARNLAAVYELLAASQRLSEEEREDWRTLTLLENSGGPIDADLLTTLRQAWAGATDRARLLKRSAEQLDQALHRMGAPVGYSPAKISDYAALKRAVAKRSMCTPMIRSD